MRSTLPFIDGIAVQRYLPAEVGLVEAAREGCNHWYVDMSLTSDLPANWPASRRGNLVAKCRDAGLTPIIHGNFRMPFATDVDELRQASIRYFETELQLAIDLSATSLIVHGGAQVEPRPTRSGREATLDRFVDTLRCLVDSAREQGVELWLENLSHYPRYRPFSYVFTRYTDFQRVRQSIPDIRFILDVGHANVNQQLALPAFSDFGDSISSLSLSNNDGDSDAHLSLGRGSLSMIALLRMIRDTGWHGIIAFETRDELAHVGLALLHEMWARLTDTGRANA
jgi:L-ribulose-5-phosphate 3-epimerase